MPRPLQHPMRGSESERRRSIHTHTHSYPYPHPQRHHAFTPLSIIFAIFLCFCILPIPSVHASIFAPNGSLPLPLLNRGSSGSGEADGLITFRNRSNAIPNRYIIQVDPWSGKTLQEVQNDLSNALTSVLSLLPLGVVLKTKVLYTYTLALVGLAIELQADLSGLIGGLPLGTTLLDILETAVGAIRTITGITLLEEDGYVYLRTGEFTRNSQGVYEQSLSDASAMWNLDRIDQRPPIGTGDGKYMYNSSGSGVHVYILDTGIHKSHQGFEGRADWVYNAFDPNANPPNAEDYHGHGTHVAGTVGSVQWGAAKKAFLHAVQVLDATGTGSDSTVIAGLEYVAHNAQRPAVVSMSLGGEASSSLDSAVRNLLRQGIMVVAAAGNSDSSACDNSPARVPGVLTVGAGDQADARADFSNWGTCVDLFAPGVDILSASNQDDVGSTTKSGTSMSTPLVSGVVAMYYELHAQATTSRVHEDIMCATTKDSMEDDGSVEGSSNAILYSRLRQIDFAAAAGSASAPTNGVGTASDGTGDASNSDQVPQSSSSVQTEQCTTSSPCEGPYQYRFTSRGQLIQYRYDTNATTVFRNQSDHGSNFTEPLVHRGWLSYNLGGDGSSILSLGTAQNILSLHHWDGSSWNIVAVASDSSPDKSILFDATHAGTNQERLTGSFVWQIECQGAAPSIIEFTFKEPSVPVERNSSASVKGNPCAVTSATLPDPDPDKPIAAPPRVGSSLLQLLMTCIGAIIMASTLARI